MNESKLFEKSIRENRKKANGRKTLFSSKEIEIFDEMIGRFRVQDDKLWSSGRKIENPVRK
jgi:hypothetical protein